MAKILILSNGHGEDLSGSILAKKLIQLGNNVDALPIVGNGTIYKKNNIKVVCKTREFSTGGLGYNSIKGRISDIFNGQICYFLKKLFLIFLIKKKYNYFLVVGDIVPLAFAWLSHRKFFVYLVAYSSHYEGKLRLPWPSKYFLSSNKLQNLYTRDIFTANDLTKQLNRKVYFYGNPFIDVFSNIKKRKLNHFLYKIILLPGSRMPELINNLCLLTKVLENLSKYKYFENIEFNFAIINSCSYQKIIKILSSNNWLLKKNQTTRECLVMQYKFITVNFRWNSFEESLLNSDLVLSMAGTATEQATGLNKPIIQIEGDGPQFTKSFANAQRRLLGKYIFCVTKYNSKKEKIDKTANLIIRILYLINLDKNFLMSCKENAKKRIGDINSSDEMVVDINNIINK